MTLKPISDPLMLACFYKDGYSTLSSVYLMKIKPVDMGTILSVSLNYAWSHETTINFDYIHSQGKLSCRHTTSAAVLFQLYD